MELHEFSRNDAECFGGAEPFSDGSKPLIGDLDDGWTTVVFDRNGAGALLGDEHDEGGGWILEDATMTPAKARVIARGIATKQDIVNLGFKPL